MAVSAAYVFSVVGYADTIARHLVVGLFWVAMVSGAIVMAAGIIWHWVLMFTEEKAQE